MADQSPHVDTLARHSCSGGASGQPALDSDDRPCGRCTLVPRQRLGHHVAQRRKRHDRGQGSAQYCDPTVRLELRLADCDSTPVMMSATARCQSCGRPTRRGRTVTLGTQAGVGPPVPGVAHLALWPGPLQGHQGNSWPPVAAKSAAMEETRSRRGRGVLRHERMSTTTFTSSGPRSKAVRYSE